MAKHGRSRNDDDLVRPSKMPRSSCPLILVLDLDHTLLHSADYSLSPEETELMNLLYGTNAYEEDDDLIPWPLGSMLIKLRPSVHSFLRQAASLGFKMCIYTMGGPRYAHFIAGLIDPDGEYFGNRIFSGDDCTRPGKKGLDVVVPPGHDSRVIIVDDTERVWEDHSANLIHVEKYKYFDTTPGYEVRSLSECPEHEEDDCALADVLDILTRARSLYFQHPDRDVKPVLGEMKMQVLEGCKIMLNVKPVLGEKPVSRMAQEMGATCCSAADGDDSGYITHVVSVELESQAANWAKRNGKFLVSPLWVVRSYHSWCRQDENEFAVF